MNDDAVALSRLLSDALPEEEAAALRQRLASEPALLRLWTTMQGLPDELAGLRDATVDTYGHAPVVGPFPQHRRARWRPLAIGSLLAASALAAFGLGRITSPVSVVDLPATETQLHLRGTAALAFTEEDPMNRSFASGGLTVALVAGTALARGTRRLRDPTCPASHPCVRRADGPPLDATPPTYRLPIEAMSFSKPSTGSLSRTRCSVAHSHCMKARLILSPTTTRMNLAHRDSMRRFGRWWKPTLTWSCWPLIAPSIHASPGWRGLGRTTCPGAISSALSSSAYPTAMGGTTIGSGPFRTPNATARVAEHWSA